jgi:hypothetical protein|tara:strand:- start:12111 stop:12302 length:192 start_codon:yes stop_codon:yes gene_type:complete
MEIRTSPSPHQPQTKVPALFRFEPQILRPRADRHGSFRHGAVLQRVLREDLVLGLEKKKVSLW